MQTAIDTYLVTSLSSNFRSVQRSEMNPPLRVTLLSPVFLRALVCWFWHRHYAKHYIALAHYAIFFYQVWYNCIGHLIYMKMSLSICIKKNVPNSMKEFAFNLQVSQRSPAQLGKEGNSHGGHIRKWVYIADRTPGLHFKVLPWQVAKLIQVKFFSVSPPRQLSVMSVLNTTSASIGILNNYTLK